MTEYEIISVWVVWGGPFLIGGEVVDSLWTIFSWVDVVWVDYAAD